MAVEMTRILLEASLAQTPERSADPFAYSRRLLKQAASEKPSSNGERRKALPGWMNPDRDRE